MSAIRKIFSEPLVQFLILGIIVFGFYSAMNKSSPVADRHVIEVGKGQITQMFETFSRTWQRPPTELEYKGLIDGYVKEEVFYREGQKMGLDQDDTVLRRRMQQKMEFLLEPSAEELTPKPGELGLFLKANAEKYLSPPQLAFGQIFFTSDTADDNGEMAAKQALAQLTASPSTAPDALGDPTLLPGQMALSNTDVIASVFDEGFTKQLLLAPTGQWFGPVRSQYGVHLVIIGEKRPARAPLLADVENAVQSDWESARRKQIADKRYAEMRKQYEVKIELPANLPISTIEASGVK